jgi:hypothetical protein
MQPVETEYIASLQPTAQDALLKALRIVMPNNSSGPCILPCWVMSQGFFIFILLEQTNAKDKN